MKLQRRTNMNEMPQILDQAQFEDSNILAMSDANEDQN